jgi:hypothetical protein
MVNALSIMKLIQISADRGVHEGKKYANKYIFSELRKG